MRCTECDCDIKPDEVYRCRICHLFYCKDCSLKHFGLYEDKNGEVKYKSIFKTILWLFRKKIFGR